jgi:hypothetical protein
VHTAKKLEAALKLLPERVLQELVTAAENEANTIDCEDKDMAEQQSGTPKNSEGEKPLKNEGVNSGGGKSGGGNGGNGSGDGDGGSPIDPALMGLIRNLPSPGSNLGPKRRKALVDAFAATINFLYPEEEDA